MRLRIPSVFIALLAITPAFPLAGCGNEPTPEEKQADSTLVLAKGHLDSGRYREGRQLLSEALSLDLKLNRSQQLAEEYSLLAKVSTLSAEFDSAIAFSTRAIEQYKSLNDRTNARTLLLELASLRRQMGQDRIAYAMYTEALGLSHVFNDVTGMREIQFAMLPVSRALENSEEHGQTINDLLKAYMESGDAKMQSRAYYESALTFMHRKEYAPAVEPLVRALTFAEQARDSLLAIQVLALLADAYGNAGNTQLAFETYTDALTRSDRTFGAHDLRLEMLIRVGNIYARNAQPADAGRFYRAALSSAVVLKNRLAEGYLFIQLGYCALGRGQFDEALKSVQTATELFTPVSYSPGMAYASFVTGIIHQRAGRPNDALALFKIAVEHKEHCATQLPDVYAECERISLQGLSYYDFLIELLFQVGRSDEAFWYAERKAARTLFEQFNALDVHTKSNEVNAYFENLSHARALRTGAERQLAITLMRGPDNRALREDILLQQKKAGSAFEDAASAILKLDPRYEPVVRFDGMTIADAQKLLPDGVVLLRSVPTSRSLYTFALTNISATVQLAAVGRELMQSIATEYTTTFRQLVAMSDSPAVMRRPREQYLQDLSTQMYAGIIRPVETVLLNPAGVLVIADDNQVPVHALRKGGPGAQYCIERFPISYLPSLAVLKFKAAPPTAVRDIVGLGYPGTTSWDVEYELRDIRAFYKDTRLYFDQRASLPTLQQERADLLHLALDMRFTRHSPGNSYILMSDARTRGTTRDILWGDLLTMASFPTVILSQLRADSVSIDRFLPSLFLVNGSACVAVNTLPVSRKAKKFFGEMLYTALLGGVSVEASYRQALMEMIRNKDYATPHMWAAFSLWGRGGM